MVDHSIKGDSGLMRTPEAGRGALRVTRFLVRASGPDAQHNTVGLLFPDDNVPIRPDAVAERDEIGGGGTFGSDPADFGVFPIAVEADYDIDVFAEIEGTGALTTGHMLISIETNVSEVNPSQPSDCFTGLTPRANASDTIHFAAGTSFEVHVKVIGVDDSSVVARASITVTKLN